MGPSPLSVADENPYRESTSSTKRLSTQQKYQTQVLRLIEFREFSNAPACTMAIHD
ncbi:uncharacterized protein PHALS_06302 [Plasmopara halstedii]|uniref:Uncharacterized protein n=1 Tax=Plasmopara halstedii TaxID=4781 RepID=A0A0N7L7Z9_PLAHL|nr:uncharacterized protein PHALS_06302 [Plasmopara halstedii]CEG48483.1 hypothetical protein PHALS_06302 [Plasmopara halstedii]|eukprot:XP_024584852.1 hypothetical protein PHALS_06302 [Plasmopara halstedii]